jgi:hypothetical protein
MPVMRESRDDNDPAFVGQGRADSGFIADEAGDAPE